MQHSLAWVQVGPLEVLQAAFTISVALVGVQGFLRVSFTELRGLVDVLLVVLQLLYKLVVLLALFEERVGIQATFGTKRVKNVTAELQDYNIFGGEVGGIIPCRKP